MTFPKIIIIGETFRSNGGGGITMTNLFKEWPSENIGVITNLIPETNPETKYLYYQLGSDEIKLPFPFHLFQMPTRSGSFTFTGTAASASGNEQKTAGTNKVKGFIFSSFNNLLDILGLYTFFYKIRLSTGLKKWIVDFAPDIVYVQPFHHRVMRFGNLLYKQMRIPYAVHIMDDSVNYINKSVILRNMWQKIIVKDFGDLIKNATVRMCISDAMANEYKARYGKNFMHFRNPVEVNHWLTFRKDNVVTNPERVRIIYTGRLYSPTFSTLVDLCKVIDALNRRHIMAEVDIYTHDINDSFYQSVKDLKGVNIKAPISVKDIPSTIHKYDIFFLCLDFDNQARRYSQFSVSTRTSEGMASGVPILMYGPQSSAQYSYFEKTEAACLVGESDTSFLEHALLKLWKDTGLRKRLITNALRTVKNDNDATIVRENFRKALSIHGPH